MNNNIFNNKGFTLIEVLISTLLLAIISLPIFYNSLQSYNNYLSAEKYYQSTIDAQNILIEVKAQLDKDIDKYTYDSIYKKYTNNTYPMNLFEYLTSVSAEKLGLDINKYSYELYLKKYDKSIDENSTIASINDNSLFIYNYSLLNPAVYTENAQIKFIDYDFKNINSVIPNETGIIADNKGNITVINNSNSSYKDNTINLNLDILLKGKNFENLYVKNYKSENIIVNMYSSEDINYNSNTQLSIQSYNTETYNSGSVKVNFYNKIGENQSSYIIIIIVTDNSRNNKVLKQLIDVYSSI